MKTKATKALLLALAIGLVASPLAARNIKIAKVGEPDAHDVKSLVASVIAGCTTDEEKAIALWAYIARRPFFFWWARDHTESTKELGFVLDPILRFNVHGSTICFQAPHSLAAMCEEAGIKARAYSLPGHVVMEMFYDGGWHVLDPEYDCASYYRSDVAPYPILPVSVVRQDSEKHIMQQQRPSDPYFQWDHLGGKFIPWGSMQYVSDVFYKPYQGQVYASLRARGHTVHMDLRRGERLTRYWSKTGRFYSPAAWYEAGGFYDMTKGPYDLRNRKNHYVNGLLSYEPDWTAHQNNFDDGLYEGTNYLLQGGKVHPAGPGECHVTFRVQSPYLIVGKPGRCDLDGDSYGGAIIEAEFHRKSAGQTNSIALSVNNGLTWQTVWTNGQTGTRRLKLDITNQVEGTYGYLIKVRLLADDPADASLADLKLTNWLFMTPVPLPAIKSGVNRFKFTMKPQHAVFWMMADMADSSGYTRYFDELYNLFYSPDFTSHLSTGASGLGYAVVKVPAPAGWKINSMTVMGDFSAGFGTPTGRAQILYKAGAAGKWIYAWKEPFEYGSHWRRTRSTDINLAAPADECYVKFTLKRGNRCTLNTYRIYAHCTRPEPPLSAGSVKITHSWFADGKAESKTIHPNIAGDSYAVRATGTTIINRAIIVEVANDPPAAVPGAPSVLPRAAERALPAGRAQGLVPRPRRR